MRHGLSLLWLSFCLNVSLFVFRLLFWSNPKLFELWKEVNQCILNKLSIHFSYGFNLFTFRPEIFRRLFKLLIIWSPILFLMLKKVSLLNASTTVSSSPFYRAIETSLSTLFPIPNDTFLSSDFVIVNNSARVDSYFITWSLPLYVPASHHFDSSIVNV